MPSGVHEATEMTTSHLTAFSSQVLLAFPGPPSATGACIAHPTMDAAVNTDNSARLFIFELSLRSWFMRDRQARPAARALVGLAGAYGNPDAGRGSLCLVRDTHHVRARLDVVGDAGSDDDHPGGEQHDRIEDGVLGVFGLHGDSFARRGGDCPAPGPCPSFSGSKGAMKPYETGNRSRENAARSMALRPSQDSSTSASPIAAE